MKATLPLFKSQVSGTPLLFHRNSAHLEMLEVANPNTTQVFIQLFDSSDASKVKVNVTFTVNATTDVVTSAAHGLSNGTRLRLMSTTTLPAGLSIDTDYFVINATTNTFQLSTRKGGDAVDMTDTGTGTHTFTSHFIQSYLVPAGDGTNYGAVTKDQQGLVFTDGLCVCITTTQTGGTAPVTPCGVNLTCS